MISELINYSIYVWPIISFIILLLITVLFLLSQQKALKAVSEENRRIGLKDLWFQLIPFFNLYKLKLRGKRNPIYFIPAKNIDPAFGLMARDTSKMGSLVEKKKKELGIK